MGSGNALTGLGQGRRPAQPHSVMEGSGAHGWKPATVETCRVIDVNIEDWSVNCVSEYGSKRYFDIQVSSPYFHFANGEGIYAQPEIGSLVWVCVPSGGAFAAPFVMGFQSAHDEDFDGFRGGRQTLNPGDIMMRTRDENFVILRRGGVVQIGATPVAQRMYIPLRNFIKDFCENYELKTFGGELLWLTQRDDQSPEGDAFTKFSLLVKEKASNPEHIADLTIGSHGANDPLTIDLVIRESGEKGAAITSRLNIEKTGEVSWSMEKSIDISAKTDVKWTAREGNMELKALKGKFEAESDLNMKLKSNSDLNAEAGFVATVKGGTSVNLDAPLVNLGGQGAASPVPKGDLLASLLSQMIGLMVAASSTPVPPFSPVAAFAPAAGLVSSVSPILSKVSLTK